MSSSLGFEFKAYFDQPRRPRVFARVALLVVSYPICRPQDIVEVILATERV